MQNTNEPSKVKFGEAAWVSALLLLSLGVCLMSKAGYGVSMIVSPAYVIHLSFHDELPFLTFGMASYLFEGLLLIIMCISVRRFRWQYLLSFGTAVIYGLLLDMWTAIFGEEHYVQTHARIIAYTGGLLLSALSIAMFFRSYLPPEVYDLLPKEIHRKYKFKQGIIKWVYDIASFVLAVALTLIINRDFTGISIGTLVCTIFNAPLIAMFGKYVTRVFSFEPAFPRLKAILTPKEKPNEVSDL